MAHCTSCGQENAPEFRFCGSCGHALSGGCPSCGFENPPGQRFCGSCGARLTAAPREEDEAHQRGERRLATVLFADVVGFTSLAEDSDPETVATAVDEALRRMAQIVVNHGGTVDKYIGDSIMALFGIPASHGDDAERAVAAALAMRAQGGELRFSIGINSGEVMATIVGEGGELTAIGDAVNIASRLEETASSGEILVGALTAELVAERFVLRAREPALLKGKREPVTVFEVVAERARGEGESGTTPPLVDREADLNFLVSCWHRAAAHSRAQVVLLTGDAGIGKTRIADELAAVARDDAVLARTACPGYGSLVGARVGAELARGLAGESAAEVSELNVSLDEQGVLRLRRLLAERASERPVLVVIDDMHNAGRADLEPLAQLAARAADLPVMLLLVGRPQPGDWLAAFGGATTIRLEPLTGDDAARLATAIAGELPLAAEAAEGIAAESRGNPLHIRELVRLLVSSQGLVVRSGRYSLGERHPLPASLHAVLSARLDALSPGEKNVLQDVAIFSDGAEADEMSVLAGHDVSATLERLVTAGLLHQERSGRYALTDPLLREVAYEQLPHAARGERHRKAAAVAATPLGRARHLGLAATYVTTDGNLRDEASASLASTGLELLETTDFRGGVELLRQAVALGHADPDVLIRLAQTETDLGNSVEARALLERVDTAGDPRLEAAVLHARAVWVHPDPDEAIEMLAEAARRWEKLGNESKRAWALANRGNALFQLGRVDIAGPDIETALEIFRRIGDRAGAAAAGQQLSLVKPDDPRVPALLAEGLQFAEDTGDLVKMRNALIPLAWVRFIRCQLGGEAATADAITDAERLAQVSHEMGDPAFEVQGHCLAAVLHRLLGRLEQADERIRLARRVTLPTDSMSVPFLEAAAFITAVARGGDPASRPAPATNPGPIAVMADALIIESLLLAGHVEAALDHLAASPLDIGPGASPLLARLIGVTRGAVLVFTDRYKETEETLAAAREAARAVDALPTEVTAIALQAECRYRQGREQEARELLGQIRGDPGGVAGLLRDRVRLLLGEPAMEQRVRESAAALLAPGLALDPAPAAS
jgi:class 3 adenylate cyclase/tetratricopeptide (TPR) repeat protein